MIFLKSAWALHISVSVRQQRGLPIYLGAAILAIAIISLAIGNVYLSCCVMPCVICEPHMNQAERAIQMVVVDEDDVEA